MALQPREKKLMIIWVAALAVSGTVYFWPESAAPVAAERYTDVATAEQRLMKLRQMAASIPAREKVAEEARKELAGREENLAHAPTAAQEQAALLQSIRRLARGQMIELQQSDVGSIAPFGKDDAAKAYGEALVSVTFTCRVEQLVNLIADISAQKELIATHELQIRQADEKRKTVNVRLTLSALTPAAMLEVPKA